MRTSSDADTIRGASSISSSRILQVNCPDDLVPVVHCMLALLQEMLSFVKSGDQLTIEEVSRPISAEILAGDNSQSKLVVTQEDLSAHYKGKACFLGSTTSFVLLKYFLRRANTYLSVAELRQEVWDDKPQIQDGSIKRQVRILRNKLCKAGLSNVTIKCDQRGYFMLVLK